MNDVFTCVVLVSTSKRSEFRVKPRNHREMIVRCPGQDMEKMSFVQQIVNFFFEIINKLPYLLSYEQIIKGVLQSKKK